MKKKSKLKLQDLLDKITEVNVHREEFVEKIERESDIPAGPVPTPRLPGALKKIIANAGKIKR